MKIHIVRNKESMVSIAEKYNVPFQEVVRLNKQIANPDDLMQGMKVKIPSQKESSPQEEPSLKRDPVPNEERSTKEELSAAEGSSTESEPSTEKFISKEPNLENTQLTDRNENTEPVFEPNLSKDSLSRHDPPARQTKYLPEIYEDEQVWMYKTALEWQFSEAWNQRNGLYTNPMQPLHTELTYQQHPYSQQQPMNYGMFYRPYNPCGCGGYGYY